MREKYTEKLMGNRLFGVLAATLGASIFVVPESASSDEIKVMASNGFKEAYLELVAEYEKAGKHRVATSFVGSIDIMKKMNAGETADLVIVSSKSLEELIKLGKVAPGSRVDLAKSGVGVAVRKGAARPDISSTEALKRTLLAAKSIGYSSGPSGVYLIGLFQRMGIAGELKSKVTQTPPGVMVGGLIERGEVEIGFQQVSELMPFAGVDLFGTLPAEIQEITVFSGGVHVGAKRPAAAKDLLKYLTLPASAPIIRKKGMEPA
jgi:molybdate transport system substrate-binding protein